MRTGALLKQIILIEDRIEFYSLIESNLLNSFEDVEIISKLNSSDALTTLELLPSISLVICRDCIDDEETAKDIIRFLEKNLFKTKVIVLGEIPKRSYKQFINIPHPQDYLDVITHTSQMLKIPIIRNKNPDSDYAPVPIDYFSDLETSICNVYLCHKKAREPNRYTKIIHAGETFNKAEISNLKDAFVFVPNQERQQFANVLSDQLIKKMDQINRKQPSLDEKNELFTTVHKTIAWEIHFQGFGPAAVQLAEKLVDDIMQYLVPKHKPISTILQEIANTDSDYMYKHGHMVFTLSTRVLNEIGVTDQNVYRNFCFASMFKDISLINKPLLSQITNFEKLESTDMSRKDYNAVINHACESAFALKNNLPKKPLELIMRHHGHPSGNGFSNTHFGKFDIMDRVFFINCEFVKEFLTFEHNQRFSNQKATPITYRLRRRYFIPEISDAIDILNKTLQKNKKTPAKA